MATLLFSHHSSNPLEAHSSDSRNKLYLKTYTDAKQKCELTTSDDPLESYPADDVRRYHQHIAQVVPGHPQTAVVSAHRFVDLDEDMDSDDELRAFDNETTPQKAQGVKQETLDDDGISEDDEDELNQFNNAHRLEDYDEEMDDWDGVCHSDYEDQMDESEEEHTLQKKSSDEQAEIEQEIEDLIDAVPQLERDYKLIDRLGTGTFSSVYKAIDLHYHDWDNTPWLGHHPAESSSHYLSLPRPKTSRAFVAVKRIYVTSGPDRIRNELMIMEMCRGCRHISQLITAFRNEDQVAIVMPYHRNDDFREYYPTLPIEGVKAYFRSLLRALRDTHERGIIHRDVKPANFLFDPRTGQGALCDFGLAQRMEEKLPTLGACLHTNPLPGAPHGKTRSRNEYSIDWVKRAQTEARNKSKMPSEKVGYPDKDQRIQMKANRAGTRGFRAPEVLLKCGQQNGAIDVWSVGIIMLFFLTGKFPLFQSNDDVEALMEIAAIIGRVKMEKVATLHSRTFATNIPDIPPDEMPWREFVKKLNPKIQVRPEPDLKYYPYTLPAYRSQRTQQGERQQKLKQGKTASANEGGPSLPPLPPTSSSPLSLAIPLSPEKSTHLPSSEPPSPGVDSYSEDIENAFDLLEQLLNPESTKRITPRQALYHKFLRDKGKRDDDHYVPHPYGQGVCAELHFKDEVTEQPGVIMRVNKCVCECGECKGGEEYTEFRKLVPAGEGIAIGLGPCEFHKDVVFL